MPMSFHPRVWLNPVLPAIWPIEKEMYMVAISHEEQPVADLLRSQLTRYNFARRYQRGREVFFYRSEFGFFNGDRGPKVDVSQREIPWFEFALKLRSGKNIKAKFYLIDGTACYIQYSTKANRHMIKDAAIAKMKRFDWNEKAMAKQDSITALGFTEQLESLSREPALGSGFPRFVLPKEAYEIVLTQGDFITIGELPGEGTILAYSGSELLGVGVYIGFYDQDEVEFVSTNLMDAADKLKRRTTASKEVLGTLQKLKFWGH